MSLILVDGTPTDSIPVTDSTVLRGDGCFEAMRSYGGALFALGEHLDRLESSAASLRIDVPPHSRLEDWCERVAEDVGDGVVRLVLSRGDALPGGSTKPRCVVLGHPAAPTPVPFHLQPVDVPWHAGGRDWALAGAKTISYAPNMAATREATELSAHDALMISRDGWVLEGPTFAVAWVVDGTLETPSLELSILDSITRRHVLRLAADGGMTVNEGAYELGRIGRATEVMALSTVKEVAAVHRVGEFSFAAGPVTERLADRFQQYVAEATR